MKIICSNYNKYLKKHKLECKEKDNSDNILREYMNNINKINNINNFS